MFTTYVGVLLTAAGLAIKIRNHIAKPVSVSSIVKNLHDTVTNLQLHAEDKAAAVDHHEAQIAAHTEAKADAKIEHAKAITVATNLGILIGAHS